MMKTLRIWPILVLVVFALVAVGCRSGEINAADLEVPEDAVARIVFFRADDCEHCGRIYDEVIVPLMRRCGENLEVKSVDIADPLGYEVFLATEEGLIGEAGRWEIPTVVFGESHLTGYAALHADLLPQLQCMFRAGGNDWPPVEALAQIVALSPDPGADAGSGLFGAGNAVESCAEDDEVPVCGIPTPIFALYLTEAECGDSCDRTRYDLRYLQGIYPDLTFEERVITEHMDLARALGRRHGVPEAQWGVAPAVLVGDDYLVGDDLALNSLRETLTRYAETGATATWYAIDVP